MNLRCSKVSSHGLADPARLQGARARWLGELPVQDSKLARVSRPSKVAGGTSECRKVSSHGLADPARLQGARAWWLNELAVQESKLARVSRLGKVASGTSEVARRTCGVGKGHERGGSENLRCRKVNSHGLADLARLQEARARWFGELAVQESKLARVSRPSKVAGGTSEVVRRTCSAGKRHERGGSENLQCRKVNSHGLADLARLQEARARWFGELAVQESKLARVSRPSKVAGGTSEVVRRTCSAGKRHERGGSENLQCRKVNSHGLADLARLQEARARWFGELAVQESKLARVSRPSKVAGGTSEVVRRTCSAGKRHERGGSENLQCRKVNSHGLADLARLQEARARWFGELAVQESKLARVSRPSKVAGGTSEVVRRTCSAGKRHERGGSENLQCRKVNSHGLADLARLQEARARWFGELAVQESKLARVSRPSKVAGGTSEVVRRTCSAGKKVISHGIADPARLQEARAGWLGEFAVQKTKLTQVRKPDKVVKGMSVVARRTCGVGKLARTG
ncbi:hypothetical protein CRG98_045909 [Punica granatum]|uniref:Uncharacterized protein n=1 Tax=Punica granatum TaxID=22663 RepID=A0A2I0HPQ1_PUNGR|nr:hypothetical protein CRG98_045909 [Punica granatum]